MTEETKVAEKRDIKELLEVVKGLGVVAPLGVEILADGELSTKDIKPVVEALKKYEVVVEAIKGIGEVVPEAKDLDTIELAQLGSAVLEVIRECKAAHARGK